MKIAYFDCFAGGAGDMLVAAMLDVGLDLKFLKAQIASLGIKNLDLTTSETSRAGLRALQFKPTAPDQHQHRNLKDITKIITSSSISDNAKKTAISIFQKLAAAEAAVHGSDPNDIHFHEIGALDSIVDIVSAAIGLQTLAPEKIYCSPLSVGSGTVKCDHGILPVPAPATAELLKGIPISAGPAPLELLTPTAAAILVTVVDEFSPLPPMKIDKIGYGAGSRESENFPNIVRLILGQAAPADTQTADSVCLLETNIDDATGELIAYVNDKLFQQGALDVFTTPIRMKHNRPAVQLSVICKVPDIQTMEQTLFEQGLTFGIRRRILQRTKLARNFLTVKTPFGEIKIKVGSLEGRVVNAKPEFSDCAAAAQKHSVPVKAVIAAAVKAYEKES